MSNSSKGMDELAYAETVRLRRDLELLVMELQRVVDGGIGTSPLYSWVTAARRRPW
mgnify:FL=1